MRHLVRVSLPRFLAVLLLGLCLSSRAEAQFYTFRSNWNIDAAGNPAPTNPYLVLFPPQWAGFAPRISVGVVDDGGFGWTSMTLTQVAGPAGVVLFPQVTVTNGAVGCNNFVDSACANLLGNPRAGIYTFMATVNPGLAMGMLRIVVGGGSGPPVVGERTFVVTGNSTGVAYSFGLSLGDANPVMINRPALPNGSPGSAFAADFVATIGAVYPGVFIAALTAPGSAFYTIDTVPADLPFRFWMGDAAGTPMCQVTGGACEFNPQITDATAAASVPAMPVGMFVTLLILVLAVATILLACRRRVTAARTIES